MRRAAPAARIHHCDTNFVTLGRWLNCIYHLERLCSGRIRSLIRLLPPTIARGIEISFVHN
ncbi:hypothetical protein EBBID32_16490 [Sphingobium indicum BiD32]|uniref:Uncharacterized protein n=1 Tax=Sphingobium indicum BiD32 TaxID=1301087 RepID=N1MJC3_9SPHN|nr:hypothetical protein EBBID32_16490 [Sphingobium indicum BiD32]